MATPKKKTPSKSAEPKSGKKSAPASEAPAKARKDVKAEAESNGKAAAPAPVPTAPPPAVEEAGESDETPVAGNDAGGAEGAPAEAAAHPGRRPKHTPAIFKLPKKNAPVVFTIDDVRDVLKNRREEAREEAEKKEAAARKAARALQVVEEQQQQRVLAAATLADILGFAVASPAAQPKAQAVSEKDVPARFRKYYRMLIDLRDHVRGGLDEHSRDSLKTSAREDSGDIADSDANSDAFDRDFALSLVANEQEAIAEIDAAIQRMVDGNYGVCEITGKQISAERLEAVPFTRYSLEGQAEFERQNRRRTQRSGSFLDSAEDVNAFGGEDAEE